MHQKYLVFKGIGLMKSYPQKKDWDSLAWKLKNAYVTTLRFAVT